MPISIVIAEDDSLLRPLLAERLAREEDFEVVGRAGTGREAVAMVTQHAPDLLLLDLNLPELSGWEVMERLASLETPPRVLVLSGEEGERTQLEAARAGAQGFMCKSLAVRKLPEAIRAIFSGDVWFPREVIGQVFRDYPRLIHTEREQEKPLRRLSDREREVLIRVARGLTNQQIAGELYMSISTVKVHISSILQKLDLPNRTEAAVFAVREGLLDH
ncbi:MAG: response regulator [Armatimonadota bacterium]